MPHPLSFPRLSLLLRWHAGAFVFVLLVLISTLIISMRASSVIRKGLVRASFWRQTKERQTLKDRGVRLILHKEVFLVKE